MSWCNRLQVLLIPLLLLSGCSTVPPLSDPCVRDYALIQSLVDKGGWIAQGRLAIRQGEEGWHVKLRWQQYSDHFRIQLDPIIGSGLRFEGTESRVIMSKSSGEPVSVGHPEQVLLQQTGFHFPLNRLRYWVLGLNGNHAGLKAQSCPMHFYQDGWKVEYGPYKLVGGVSLPRKITITNDEVRIRLIIDEWSIAVL